MSCQFSNIEIVIKNGIIADIRPSDNAIRITDISGGDTPVSNSYQNHFLLPSFTDSHIHLFGLGMKLGTLSLFDCYSMEECLERCIQYRGLYRGEWLLGIGWNENQWQNKILPNRHSLDAIFPDIPVYLVRSDGHSVWCNTLALKLSGIECNRPILRSDVVSDSCAYPLGIVDGYAKEKMYAEIPRFSLDQEMSVLMTAQNRLLRYGIGAVCDMDTEFSSIVAMKELEKAGKLIIDVYSYLSMETYMQIKSKAELFAELSAPNSRLKIQGVKLFADGTLGGGTAALFEPYCDNPQSRGELRINENDIISTMRAAEIEDLDIAIHCIGDRANDMVSNSVLKARRLGVNSRIRVEHAQVMKKETIQKFAEAEIVASVQPIHFNADSKELLQKTLGEKRLESAYRWKSLVEAGVNIVSGSDAPVESENPLQGILAYSNRNIEKKYKYRISTELLAAELAIKSYSENISNLLKKNSGKVEIGKNADILLINSTIHSKTESSEKKIELFLKNGKKIKK